jgi:DNA-binding transcriptional LysR family regulator
VFDGIVPVEPLLLAVGALAHERVPTRIDVRAEFLAGVEDGFVRSGADLMIAVLPPRLPGLTAVALPTVHASLVAHRDHPLGRGRHGVAALRQHVLVTVRGSDPRLVHLNDFASKRAAILAGIGFGWLPDAMIGDAPLVRVRWSGAATHRFHPRLYHRGHPGPAGRRLIAALAG